MRSRPTTQVLRRGLLALAATAALLTGWGCTVEQWAHPPIATPAADLLVLDLERLAFEQPDLAWYRPQRRDLWRFGGLMALFLTGNSLSYTAVIGFVALIGIEIKNSILLVDFTTQLRREGMGLRAAIERAGEVRFLPVLLTSVTAIGGLLPLALFGGSLYAPLASVIIGGLISSTLLSRIVTPVMYLLIARGGEKDDDGKAEPVAPVVV